MENLMISNSQITSSSVKDQYSRQINSRLNLVGVPGQLSGGWIASDDDIEPWIKIDFKVNITLRAIITQARDEATEWVKKYEVSFGTSAHGLKKYTENGQVKVGKLLRSSQNLRKN